MRIGSEADIHLLFADLNSYRPYFEPSFPQSFSVSSQPRGHVVDLLLQLHFRVPQSLADDC